MIIIPAIDIRGGNVVRLIRGDYNQEKTYAHDPVLIADKWIQSGAQMLHIVDLDGARDGLPVNTEAIEKIVAHANIPIQVGGGMRSLESIKKVLALGVSRVIVGTKALDSELLKILVSECGSERIVVGIDAAEGIVKTDGWLKDSGLKVESLCETIIECGVSHVVFTDIACDGMMQGPNLESLQKVLDFKELQVVASGGVSTLDDVKNIHALNRENVFGIIIGKAIYEGAISIAEANAVVQQ